MNTPSPTPDDQAPEDQSVDAAAGSSRAPKANAAKKMLEIAFEEFDLGRADDGRGFALRKAGPNVAIDIADALGPMLTKAYYVRTGGMVPKGAVSDVVALLGAFAHDAAPQRLWTRVGEVGAEDQRKIIFDLGTADGSAIEIDSSGYRVINRSPVIFRHSGITMPAPMPEPGGTLDELRGVLNAGDDSTWHALLGWLVVALFPSIPHPILVVSGEAGSGKSSVARRLVDIVDPQGGLLRAAPKDNRDFFVTGAASWVVALDNLASVRGLADNLCLASTGGSMLTRGLYTNKDVSVTTVRNAFVLTGIDLTALPSDLGDRVALVELQRIADHGRRREAELDQRFARAHPRILGALFDAVAQVLAMLPTVSLSNPPRMADAAHILAALDKVAGTQSLTALLDAGGRLAMRALESDVFIQRVVRMVIARGATWTGTGTELLDAIPRPDNAMWWPADAAAAGKRLRERAPSLRKIGVDITEHRTRSRREITITVDTSNPAASALRPHMSASERIDAFCDDPPIPEPETEATKLALVPAFDVDALNNASAS